MYIYLILISVLNLNYCATVSMNLIGKTLTFSQVIVQMT